MCLDEVCCNVHPDTVHGTDRTLIGPTMRQDNALPALCIAKVYCRTYCLILIAVTVAT